MNDGYLSRDRAHLAGLQRKRRARMVRIDYMPGEAALAAINARRATVRAGSVCATNSALIDAIVIEWAALAGINCCEIERSKSSGRDPEFSDTYTRARMTSEAERSGRARESGGLPGIAARIACGREHESGHSNSDRVSRGERGLALRVPCGAKRHRDGLPCRAASEPGKRRCRFHGGKSTGPRTPEGKARALANLKRGQVLPQLAMPTINGHASED